MLLVSALLPLLLAARTLSAQAPPPATEAQSDPEIGARAVVSVTPVMGVGLAPDLVPSNVQLVDEDELSSAHPISTADALERRVGGITVNDVQSNPLQRDVSFRGFSASPLLGTPQGIAVFQNGVRVNEPFGDVLQWDLIPEFAVQQAQIIPGSNPVFGENSLGGSIALRMKNGYSSPGFRLLGSSGSFARTRGVIEYGSIFDDIAVYEGMGGLYDGGFRDHSHSHAVQFYSDVRHAERRYELAANLTIVASSLRGNGPIPVDQLARDRSAVYTWPDITDNALVLLSSQADVELEDWLTLQTTAYVRHLGRQTLNGDEAEFVACDGRDALCSEDSDRPLRNERGQVLPAAAASDAVLHTTDTSTSSYGATVQTTWGQPLARHDQQLIVGASASGASTDFDQRAQIAMLTDDREVTGGTAFLGGAEYRTSLGSHDLRAGLYATDTFAITRMLHLTLSARLNHARIALEDQLGRALDGTHHFTRINPAAGLTYRLPYGMSAFGGYSESSRAPTAAELACADPGEPCRVPNAFLSDPALQQVVARSLELGVRGRERIANRSYLRWAVAGFAARNHADILFVAGSHVGTGYFRNAGDTQRAGFEANLEGRVGFVEWFASYQFLRATFEDSLTLPGANNPRARIDARGRPVLDVQKGDRLPGMPAHSLKLGFTVTPLPGLRVGPQARYTSSQYLRGDEANLLDPLSGYFVLDAHASYRVLPWLMLFVDAENLLDAHYDTFGILGQASEVLPYAKDPRFVGIGAPLGVWGGVEVDL